MRIRPAGSACALSVLTLLLAIPAAAGAQPLKCTKIDSDEFETRKKGKFKDATDLSGIACLPPDDAGNRTCLVINDQDKFAQRATLRGGKLRGGERVRLIDDDRQDDILGKEPKRLACSGGEGEFKDLDGEGVAYAQPFFYVVGSHGCSRKHRDANLSSFILARVKVDGEGEPEGKKYAGVDTTYRLNELLRAAPKVGDYYGKDLNEADGLNFEGIAVTDGTIYVGLRAPSIDRKAFLVKGSVDDLFSRKKSPPSRTPEIVELELGDSVGIRDLAPLGDGRLLVLSGPTREQAKIPFRLHAADPKTGRTELFGTLDEASDEDGDRAKAEAVLPLDGAGREVLVLFDGPKHGGARICKR